MTNHEVTRPRLTEQLTRGIIWTVFGAAVLAMLSTLVFGIVRVISALGSGEVTTSLDTVGVLPPDADSGTAVLEFAAYESAMITVSGLSSGSMAVIAIGAIAATLAGAAFALSLAVLSWNLLKPAPFGPGLSNTVTVGGGIVLLCGLVGIGFDVMGSWLIVEQLNTPGSGIDGFWPMSAAVDLFPIGIGMAMLLIGLAFDYAHRLQRDAAGLV